MNRFFFACVFALAGILLNGCDGGGLTPNQKAAANRQWNDARAGVLAGLAYDQYSTGSFDKCQETLDQALRIEPDNAAVHVLAARLAIERGKLEEAKSHLAIAAKFDPKNAEVDYLTGIVLQRWQLLEDARGAYKAARIKNPAELSYLLAEGETLVALGRPVDALALLQSNVSSFEHSGVLLDEIGQLLVQQKQYDVAVNVLRRASLLANNDSSIGEHLAFALLGDHQYGEAAGWFARIVKEPGYENRADLYGALGQCESEMNQLVPARDAYETATKLNSSCAGYWLGLGKVTVQQGDLPASETAVQKALAIDPSSSGSQCLLGYIRLCQEQLPASLAAFKAASDLDPGDSVGVCLQGYVLAKMGHVIEARPFYSKALKLNPRDELASKLLTRVDANR